jgi:Tol biopolymer transport system component
LDNPDIYLVNADGDGMRRLTSSPAWDVFPAWSPDGRKIAFDSDRMGNFDIWVIEVEGP